MRSSVCFLLWCFAAALSLCLSGAERWTSAEDAWEWPSFRGGVYPGVAVGEGYPTQWDLESGLNVQWQAAVPGIGHSSPVICGDLVIVTTAYSSHRQQVLLDACGVGIAVAIVLLAVVLGLCISADVVSIVNQRDGAAFYWARGLFLCLASLSLFPLWQLGAPVFDYARCPIRSWLGPHLAVTVGAATALSLTLRRRWLRAVNAILLVFLAVSVIGLMPAKDHVYRQGIFGPQSLIVLSSGAVPVALLAGLFAAYAWLYRGDSDARARRYRWLVGLTTAMSLLLICVVRVARASHVEHLVTDEANSAFFPTPVVYTLLGVCLTLWIVFFAICRLTGGDVSMSSAHSVSRRINSDTVRRTAVLGCLVSSAVIAVGCLALAWNCLILTSTFLQYHLPTPGWADLSLSPLWMSLSLVVGAAFVGMGFPDWLRSRVAALGAALTCLVLIMYPLHVVVANGMHHERQLVRSVIALDRQDGSVRWTWEGFATPTEVVHRENSQATPTAAALGERVVAWFGSPGLVCLDVKSGAELWSRTDLGYRSIYGTGTSPVVAGECVIIVADAPSDARIYGVNLVTGRTMWQHDRSEFMDGVYADSGHSHTPLVLSDGQRRSVWMSGWNRLVGYDCESGTMLAEVELKGGGDRVASAAADERQVYWGQPRELVAAKMASLLDGQLDVAWRVRADSNCVSPVSDGQRVYTCSDRGVVTCVDAESGRILWRDRLAGEFRSSPIIAGGHLYLGNLGGTLHVLSVGDPEPAWRRFEFPAPIFATPAAADGQLFVRTESTVYCLATQAEASDGG